MSMLPKKRKTQTGTNVGLGKRTQKIKRKENMEIGKRNTGN